MKPASAKAKGRALQQYVRNKLISLFDLTLDDVRSTSMGAGGEDIQLSTAARAVVPLSIECKSLARHAVYMHYFQAVDNAKNGAIPTLVIKQNNAIPLVVLDLDHFLTFVKGQTR